MERGKFPTRLVIDHQAVNDPSAYPITVWLAHDPQQTTNGTTDLTDENPQGIQEQTVVRARYVVGCDGAKSWTRKEMGIDVRREESDSTWGLYINLCSHLFTLIAFQGSLTLYPRRISQTFAKRVPSVQLCREVCY